MESLLISLVVSQVDFQERELQKNIIRFRVYSNKFKYFLVFYIKSSIIIRYRSICMSEFLLLLLFYAVCMSEFHY